MSDGAPVDVAAFGAHPDDLELGCGGTLAKLARQGRRVAMVDLTRGELGTRGSPAVREAEALEAAGILRVAVRRNLGFPDGGLADTREHQRAMIDVLREFRPLLVLAPAPEGRHPDHAHASRLVTESCFYAGLRRIETARPPWRPRRVIYYPEHYETLPTFVVDISGELEAKMRAVRAYRSQFSQEPEWGPDTLLNSPHFLGGIEARARHYGAMIQAQFGEPFTTRLPVPVDNLLASLGLEDTRDASHPQEPAHGGTAGVDR